MTSARWTVLYDFMVEAELVSTKLDINDVYTLDFLPEEPVLK
jgi:NitT/TauT family transport system substrate-binding protein